MIKDKKILLYLSWTVAFISVLGSFYFSHILGFAPCTLCWYQRGFMYSLLLVITVGILRRDPNLPYYALPLSIGGLLIGIYHNLLYYGVIKETLGPCTLGISCVTKYIEWFNFVSIPLLSLISFIIITICLVLYDRTQKT